MKAELWKIEKGAEIDQVYNRGESLQELVGTSSAVYLWRRDLTPPLYFVQDSKRMFKWIKDSLSTSYVELGEKRLSHFLRVTGISLGGGSLSKSREEILMKFLEKKEGREWMRKFFIGLNVVVPPLYVGETNNMAKRVREHLRGETHFSQILQNKLNLSWDKLTLWYCPTNFAEFYSDSNKTEEMRTLLEVVVGFVALAGCTSRPG